jgi:8-amino-7-oxononanoate synthase
MEALRGRHLERQLAIVADGTEPWVEVDGRRLLNLSSNNYLGLARHPRVVEAVVEAARAWGGGAGSSRLVAGTSDLHRALEARLAAFKGAESALLFTSGYTANLGVIPALVGPGDLVLGDALNHASLIDGCRLSRAEYRTYGHRNVGELEDHLAGWERENHSGRRLVVTDTVFSMDGDLAPMADIADACDRHGALLMVDEAHATGCLGPQGRGLLAHLGLEERASVSMSTLSKAFGGLGAFVAGGSALMEYLVNVARTFMFTTALPPTVVAGTLAALEVLEQEPQRLGDLQRNARALREGLCCLGFDTLGSETHIVPVLVGGAERTLEMAGALRAEGLFAVAIRPPTVPTGRCRIRASVMATHTSEEIDRAVEAFGRVGRRLGLI